MTLGEKLFEENAKSTANAVKSIGPEGVTIELSWGGDVKGEGRLAGFSGKNMATGTYVQAPSGLASGRAQGIVMTDKGESVVWWGMGSGRTDASGSSYVTVLTFMTTSKKLAWLNGTIAVYEGRGPAGFQEWMGTAHEWK